MEGNRNDPIEAHLDVIFTTAIHEALSLRANRFEADEVAQLTTLKLWKRWKDHKVVAMRSIGGARWRAYIRQIARNTHIDLIRQHQRRLARQQRAYEHRTGTPVALDGQTTALMVDNVESHLSRGIVAEAILSLPGQQRKVAVRMFLVEMTASEIAVELGIEAQTVRKHARAARETLRQRLLEADEPTSLL